MSLVKYDIIMDRDTLHHNCREIGDHQRAYSPCFACTHPLYPSIEGNRAWEHQANVDDSEKGLLIKEIRDAGFGVLHTIIADNLTEHQSLKIEAELISAFGIRSHGGLLTNKVRPNPETINRQIKVNIPDGCYEKSQMALELMKSAVMELAKANPAGITNSDAAKYLGLQSDYGGGSKDYLSYSVIGLLMKEGRLVRNHNKKHVASSE